MDIPCLCSTRAKGNRSSISRLLGNRRPGDTSGQVAGKLGEDGVRLFTNHRLSEFAQLAEEPGLRLNN